jgi:hypothetical protein
MQMLPPPPVSLIRFSANPNPKTAHLDEGRGRRSSNKELYGEEKVSVPTRATPTASKGFTALAKKLGFSYPADLYEAIGRGVVGVTYEAAEGLPYTVYADKKGFPESLSLKIKEAIMALLKAAIK